jgi:hypothetical protein
MKQQQLTVEELIDLDDLPAFRRIVERMTPAKRLRVYLEMMDVDRNDLAAFLGTPKNNISAMSRGSRPISETTAGKLAQFIGNGVIKDDFKPRPGDWPRPRR